MSKEPDEVSDFMEDFKSLLAKYKLEDMRIVGYKVLTDRYAMCIDRKHNRLYISFWQEPDEMKGESE